jgi:hypothetical protein
VPFFTEFENDPGDFRFGKFLKKIGCGRAGLRIHSHI